MLRLRVASNFGDGDGDGDCGVGENRHARARLLEVARGRVFISLAPQSPSPKLETTRSLEMLEMGNALIYLT